jgi:hypothetical protein
MCHKKRDSSAIFLAPSLWRSLAKLQEQKDLPASESWLSPSGIDNIKTSL